MCEHCNWDMLNCVIRNGDYKVTNYDLTIHPATVPRHSSISTLHNSTNKDYDLPITAFVSRLQSPLQIAFQLSDRFPTVPMSLLLCVHMNIVFLLLYLHFAIGVLEESDLDMIASELDAVSSKWYTLGKELLPTRLHEDLDSIVIMIFYWLHNIMFQDSPWLRAL